MTILVSAGCSVVRFRATRWARGGLRRGVLLSLAVRPGAEVRSDLPLNSTGTIQSTAHDP